MRTSRMAVIIIGLFIGSTITLGAETDTGKSAWMELVALPALYGNGPSFTAPMDSSIGKRPFLVVYDGPPPRTEGIGLHFDTKKYFYVYSDYHSPANHFAPSGWMGDYGDIRLNDASREDPADGKTCLKFTYSSKSSQGFGWAGVYWQQPENNWGNKAGGYNLEGVRRLTFWARGDRGGEVISQFSIGGIQGARPDTGVAQIGPVTLTREWKQYAIDVSDANLQKISGGFSWTTSATDNPGGITFYLDEIRFER